MFRSIRHGLFAALAGFTILICVCYTGLAVVISYVTEDMLVDRLMEREAAAIAAHVRAHGELPPARSDLIRVHDRVDALPEPVRRRVALGAARAEVFTGTGQHYHLRTLDLDAAGMPRRLYLLADAGPILVVSKLVQDVGGVLVFVALGLIGLALLLAWFLSRRLVEPLQLLADEVRKVQPGGPVAFSASRRPDEIGYLAGRLGSTIAELHTALQREHAFTRDVSHELRTPLTVMNNTLVLAQSRTLGKDDFAQLQEGLDEVRDVIEVLFALARAEHVAMDVLDLRACIERSLLRLMDNGWDNGWDSEGLQLDLPERLEVTGNRHLATLLVDNCLGNALFHGGPRTRLTLGWADGVLTISNTVDARQPGRVQGFMHGQNLLERIAQAMRWELRFHADGTSYRVELVPTRTG
ncbi:sensor histidine kinase [Telluria aromaticivorans]|uniref:histidine kinase n=1 Tax=Telluria aromaticivorans TaxID=2725995 RepID=A0A7Y2NZS8_9BURK|nr:HAMP domain-containing sensor histidine kinase [Telluria aromaticivorans]NNG22811.1 HAMP domain-containing histidine kinase [Telluria aromaticivorans]